MRRWCCSAMKTTCCCGCMHHAITDNWSVAILMRELLEVYASLKAGHAPELPALRIEYADYAAWQRSPEAVAQRRPDGLLGRALARPAAARPADRLPAAAAAQLPRRPGRRDPAADAARAPARLLRPARRDALRVLLAAFKLMLARHADSSDIAVGTPIANRHRLATEQLVGTLVNTLVMRTDLSGDPDFVELVARVRETALDAYAHQDAPFDELVEVLGQTASREPEGAGARALQRAQRAARARLAGLTFAPRIRAGHTAAQFDLSMHVDTEFGHRIYLEYSTDLYAPESAPADARELPGAGRGGPGRSRAPLSRYAMVTPAQLALLRDVECRRSTRCRRSCWCIGICASARRGCATASRWSMPPAALTLRAAGGALERAGACAARARHRPRPPGRAVRRARRGHGRGAARPC